MLKWRKELRTKGVFIQSKMRLILATTKYRNSLWMKLTN